MLTPEEENKNEFKKAARKGKKTFDENEDNKNMSMSLSDVEHTKTLGFFWFFFLSDSVYDNENPPHHR